MIKKQEIDLKDTGGLIKFTKYYVFWLGEMFVNAKQITGSVINQDWSINNSNIEMPGMDGDNVG